MHTMNRRVPVANNTPVTPARPHAEQITCLRRGKELSKSPRKVTTRIGTSVSKATMSSALVPGDKPDVMERKEEKRGISSVRIYGF